MKVLCGYVMLEDASEGAIMIDVPRIVDVEQEFNYQMSIRSNLMDFENKNVWRMTWFRTADYEGDEEDC